jgi:hypothetical protein
MKDLFPYRGLSAATEEALTALEGAQAFTGLERHYRTLIEERNRRIGPFLLPVLLTAAIGALLIWVLQSIGWLPDSAPWAYAFGPILFVALVMSVVRPNAARDDARIAKMVGKWRDAARASGIKS